MSSNALTGGLAHSRNARLITLLIVLVIGIVVIVSSQHSSAHSNDIDTIRSAVTTQLPGSLSRNEPTARNVSVNDVSCVHASGNAYTCLAHVSFDDSQLGRESRVPVSISATCDGSNCIWQTS